MASQTFKQMLASTGPDRPRTPMLSREARLTRSMPPVVAELLEQRRHLSFSSAMNGTTLEITGSSGADYIGVSLNVALDSLYVFDGAGTSVPYDDDVVTMIKIWAGGGNDTVFINRDAFNGNEVQEICLIYGEAGNDSIEAGNLADTVYGGDGLDSLYGFAGADKMYGGIGNDKLYGGDSDDLLRGEDGDDSLLGEGGADDAYGGNGYDTIFGGADNDTLGGDGDADCITGDGGNDSMTGGDGNDTIWAGEGFSDTVDGGAGTDCAKIDPLIDTATGIEGFYP